MCGKELFAVRPQSDKAGALPAPSRIVLRKVISQKMSVYQRDHSDRRRERFAWRLTQSAVDEENVTAVARSAISDGACNWWNSSLRVSPPIWASATETRFTRPNRRACSLARLLRETSPWPCQYFSTFAFTFYAERRYKLKSKPFLISPVFINVFWYTEYEGKRSPSSLLQTLRQGLLLNLVPRALSLAMRGKRGRREGGGENTTD